MVDKTKRDWEGLARKISTGKPIEQAVTESGIPIEEALEWMKSYDPLIEREDYALRLLAQDALTTGFEKLKEICDEGPRIAQGGSKDMPGEIYHNVDLDAAKAMVSMGINLRKIVATNRGRGMSLKKTNPDGSSQQLDLFDLTGPWEFADNN